MHSLHTYNSSKMVTMILLVWPAVSKSLRSMSLFLFIYFNILQTNVQDVASTIQQD